MGKWYHGEEPSDVVGHMVAHQCREQVFCVAKILMSQRSEIRFCEPHDEVRSTAVAMSPIGDARTLALAMQCPSYMCHGAQFRGAESFNS